MPARCQSCGADLEVGAVHEGGHCAFCGAPFPAVEPVVRGEAPGPTPVAVLPPFGKLGPRPPRWLRMAATVALAGAAVFAVERGPDWIQSRFAAQPAPGPAPPPPSPRPAAPPRPSLHAELREVYAARGARTCVEQNLNGYGYFIGAVRLTALPDGGVRDQRVDFAPPSKAVVACLQQRFAYGIHFDGPPTGVGYHFNGRRSASATTFRDAFEWRADGAGKP